MPIDLNRLLEKAYYVEEVQNASEAIERARRKFEETTHVGTLEFEVGEPPPAEPDEEWVRERIAHPLVYYCESEGRTVPACSGVIVTLYTDSKLYAIKAEDVLHWASEVLTTSIEELDARYGTHEAETVLR